jgi:hypothetical protein
MHRVKNVFRRETKAVAKPCFARGTIINRKNIKTLGE